MVARDVVSVRYRETPDEGRQSMSSPSPIPRRESSRQYERLLRGEITATDYVRVLKAEAWARVHNGGAPRRRSATA
jgi:hypothetical protein